MELFSKPEEKFTAIIDKHIKQKEFSLISVPISYDGCEYRKVNYYLAGVKKSVLKPAGIVFFTQEGKTVLDKELKHILAKGFHRLEQLLSPSSEGRFKKAYISEKQMKSDEEDYKRIIATLQCLEQEGAEGTEAAQQVLEGFTAVKQEINSAILKYRQSYDECCRGSLSIEALNILYDSYIDVMATNFKKVKLIKRAAVYYEPLRRAAIKKRRKIKTYFAPRSIRRGLIDLDFLFSYFSRLLPIYNEVSEMSPERYRSYLKEKEETEISDSMRIIRQ